MTFNHFKSKADGMNRAERSHMCLNCRYFQRTTWKICPNCGSKDRQYFMSKKERQRGATLLLLRDAGTISNLVFQTKHELRVNGRFIDYYRPDAEYDEGETHIVEDTKPKDFVDDYARLKMNIFEALYQTTIRVP